MLTVSYEVKDIQNGLKWSRLMFRHVTFHEMNSITSQKIALLPIVFNVFSNEKFNV